jgi:hypothetical protein
MPEALKMTREKEKKQATQRDIETSMSPSQSPKEVRGVSDRLR